MCPMKRFDLVSSSPNREAERVHVMINSNREHRCTSQEEKRRVIVRVRRCDPIKNENKTRKEESTSVMLGMCLGIAFVSRCLCETIPMLYTVWTGR